MASKKKDYDRIPWGLIIFLFLIGLFPVALILLCLKLFGNGGKRRQVSARSEDERAETAGPSRAKRSVKQATRSPVAKRSTAKWLKIGGLVLAVAGLLACVESIDMIWLGKIESYYVEDLLVALAMAAGGIVMFVNGISMSKALKRYAKYLVVLGDRDAVPLEELARTLGHPKRQVEKDLQKMIEKGYFGGKAYLHMELGQFFRSGDADAARRQRQEETERAAAETVQDGYAGLLRRIRQANDRIDDPVLSGKIDRVEAVTARIFSAVEADPKKKEKIATFLNYYLPTTQKLLDSYAEFEAAGVEGENLRQAKLRIEATMDKIISGFERQLDALYKADAMDVDSDIRVMETMLRRDTASVEDDFGVPGMEA